jgi:predicted nucleic acid-binding protein
MTLVDTSAWIDHLRNGNPLVSASLDAGEVMVHPIAVGELACGNLRNRKEILSLLARLPQAKVAEQSEALTLVESRNLHRTGLGWIDAHLLASALLSAAQLFTLDQGLGRAAARLGIRVE